MKKNAKKNNKGFSLVELIIVVAIMAILIGVLGGQYLKFVEKSRQSADKSNVDEIVRAVQIYAADPDAKATVAAGTVTITATGTSVSDAGTQAALIEAGLAKGTVSNTGTVSDFSMDLKLKSKEWKVGSDNKIVITFSITNGSVNATVEPTSAAD